MNPIIGTVMLIVIAVALIGIEIATNKGKDLVWLLVILFAISVMAVGMGWAPWIRL